MKKEATGTITAAGSRSINQSLDTGAEVYNKNAKKEQRHTTNEKPDMYLNYFMTSISSCKTDLLQGNAEIMFILSIASSYQM